MTVLPSADPSLLMPGQGYWLYPEAAGIDRAALVALYNATDGANWRNNGNWLSNAPMGEWHGVTTNSDGRGTHLDLPYNQLTGGIPAELGSLTNFSAPLTPRTVSIATAPKGSLAHSPHSSHRADSPRVYFATMVLLYHRPCHMTAKSGTSAMATAPGQGGCKQPFFQPWLETPSCRS